MMISFGRFLPPGAETIWPGERRSRRSADEDQMSFCNHSYHFYATAVVVMYLCGGKFLARRVAVTSKSIWEGEIRNRKASRKMKPGARTIQGLNVPKCHYTMPCIMTESISFTNCLVLTEILVKSHMKVNPILMRETGGGVILQQSPSLAATA